MQRTGENPPKPTSEDLSWLGAARQLGLLGGLPDDVVRAAVRGAQRVQYAPGPIGLRWEEGPVTAVVLSGVLRTYLASPDGAQATVRYVKTGDATGIFAPRQPALARGIVALEPSELLFIAGARVKELALAEPRFAWALIEEITTSLHAAQRALYVRGFGSLRQRVVTAIVERAKASGRFARGSEFAGTQHELAVAVGSVREVVASVLGDMKQDGLIDIRRGGIVILEPVRLLVEADSVTASSS